MTALETRCVDAVVDNLPEGTRELVRAQLRQDFFVERIPKGRINVLRFYSPKQDLRIPAPEFSDLLMKVWLVVDGRRQAAHVTFFKGYIFSVEFKKPSRHYVGKNVTVSDVMIARPEESYTRAIDRLAHGRSEESE